MNKINQILQESPSGTVITSAFLKKKGAYKQLADAYEKSGWLERIGRGAYKRKGDKLSWTGGLYALQELQNLSVHVGGKTALELSWIKPLWKDGRGPCYLMENPKGAFSNVVSEV